MFTGIIEEIGSVRRIDRSGQALVLTIGAKRILEDVHLGDSIAVSGVCLTVIAYDASSVQMDVIPETFRHTSLHRLKPGDPVNLERAMSAQGRFGGHIVQGHVDCPGVIVSRNPEENAVVFTIRPMDPSVLKYIVPRGSIAIDGISLTVIRAGDETFAVSIIPHTLAQTVLNERKPGDSVNLETDITGKYVERLLGFQGSPEGNESSRSGNGRGGRLSESFLAEHGFL